MIELHVSKDEFNALRLKLFRWISLDMNKCGIIDTLDNIYDSVDENALWEVEQMKIKTNADVVSIGGYRFKF